MDMRFPWRDWRVRRSNMGFFRLWSRRAREDVKGARPSAADAACCRRARPAVEGLWEPEKRPAAKVPSAGNGFDEERGARSGRYRRMAV